MKLVSALIAIAVVTVKAIGDEAHLRGDADPQTDDAAAGHGNEFKGPEYIALSRQEKSDMLWGKITENNQSGAFHSLQMLTMDMGLTFDMEGDEFDCHWLYGCRNKPIHAIGNVGKARWIDLGGHSYTGIFQGADSGYVRMSSATEVDLDDPELGPGMGVKFLRDGADSANFVAMFSVEGQEGLNWFEHDWSNHVPDPVSPTGALNYANARFKGATSYTQTVGLSDMASADQTGAVETTPNFPFRLRFQPTGEFETSSDTYERFEEYLPTIPAGSVLFDIYALDQPTELGGTETKIGQLKTESTMVTSFWGDEHMFFRHQRMEDDLELRPEWEPYTPNNKWCSIVPPTFACRDCDCPSTYACPFLRAKHIS